MFINLLCFYINALFATLHSKPLKRSHHHPFPPQVDLIKGCEDDAEVFADFLVDPLEDGGVCRRPVGEGGAPFDERLLEMNCRCRWMSSKNTNTVQHGFNEPEGFINFVLYYMRFLVWN
jgi:hypothetical protein